MTNKVLYLDNLGNSLEVTDGKADVKPDNTGNVQFEVTENGLKGEVVIPEPFNPTALQEEIEQLKAKNTELEQALNAEKAKVAVSDVVNEQTADGIKVTVAKTDSSSSEFIIPKVPVEIHFENATFENGKLKVTLNDGTVKETDFTAEVLTQAINNAAPEQKSALGNAIKGLLVGEVVEDFADVIKGYLIKANI